MVPVAERDVCACGGGWGGWLRRGRSARTPAAIPPCRPRAASAPRELSAHPGHVTGERNGTCSNRLAVWWEGGGGRSGASAGRCGRYPSDKESGARVFGGRGEERGGSRLTAPSTGAAPGCRQVGTGSCVWGRGNRRGSGGTALVRVRASSHRPPGSGLGDGTVRTAGLSRRQCRSLSKPNPEPGLFFCPARPAMSSPPPLTLTPSLPRGAEVAAS